MPGEPPAPQVVAYPHLAQLIVARNKTLFGIGVALPVWIDRAKVADLGPGSCMLLLLEPGDYVVTAGTAAPGDQLGLSKLELKVSVRASGRVVAEYVIDPSRGRPYGIAPPLGGPIDKVRAEVYRFTQRPAQKHDTCPGTNEPPILRPSAAASGTQP